MPLRLIKLTRNEIISLCLGELLGLAMAGGLVYIGFSLTRIEVVETIIIMGDGTPGCTIRVTSESMSLLKEMGLDDWIEACQKMREER